MGNRAVIAFVDYKGECDVNSVGIYLHWNGGIDSVEGFLQAAKDYGLRSGSYGLARLTQIICNCFPGTISVGVDVVKKLDCDNYDNGVYWVDKNFNIVGRENILRSMDCQLEILKSRDNISWLTLLRVSKRIMTLSLIKILTRS